jgi:hypothetical protein
MSEHSDLLPLYLDSDATRIRLLGGPNNGAVVTWSTGAPPPVIETAVPEPISTLLADPTPTLRKAAYRPMLDSLGFPSRTDNGTLLYECTQA